MKAYILRGLPGSGKTTLAYKLPQEDERHARVVCEADDYFCDEDGHYEFNPEWLPYAHRDCMRKFVSAVIRGGREVICSNTNISLAEVAPYVAVAEAFMFDVEIISLDVPLDVCIERQTHGVPPATMARMAQSMAEFVPQPWWNYRVIKRWEDL